MSKLKPSLLDKVIPLNAPCYMVCNQQHVTNWLGIETSVDGFQNTSIQLGEIRPICSKCGNGYGNVPPSSCEKLTWAHVIWQNELIEVSENRKTTPIIGTPSHLQGPLKYYCYFCGSNPSGTGNNNEFQAGEFGCYRITNTKFITICKGKDKCNARNTNMHSKQNNIPLHNIVSYPFAKICELCNDSMTNFIVWDCYHETCLSCFKKTYTNKVINGGIKETLSGNYSIDCYKNCGKYILDNHVFYVLGKEAYEQHKNYVNQLRSIKREETICPSKSCGALFEPDLNQKRINNTLTCPICNKTFCFKCKGTTKPNIPCSCSLMKSLSNENTCTENTKNISSQTQKLNFPVWNKNITNVTNHVNENDNETSCYNPPMYPQELIEIDVPDGFRPFGYPGKIRIANIPRNSTVGYFLYLYIEKLKRDHPQFLEVDISLENFRFIVGGKVSEHTQIISDLKLSNETSTKLVIVSNKRNN